MHYLLKGIALMGLVVSGLLLPLHAELPEEAPLHVAFPPSQFQGETYIFQITQGNTGQIIAGSGRISYYESNKWATLPQLQKPPIRGLLVDGNSLWVASLNEIGRLDLPLTSKSRYEVLAIPEISSAGEFWQLVKAGGTLVATTKEDVWLIDPVQKLAKHVNLPNKGRLVVVSLSGRTIVSQPGVALWEVADGQLKSYENPLPDKSDTFWLWSNDSYQCLLVIRL